MGCHQNKSINKRKRINDQQHKIKVKPFVVINGCCEFLFLFGLRSMFSLRDVAGLLFSEMTNLCIASWRNSLTFLILTCVSTKLNTLYMYRIRLFTDRKRFSHRSLILQILLKT